jgi:hypothetical protein
VALADQNQEHLRLLSILYYVWAGMVALFACIPIIYLVFGVLMVSGRFAGSQNPPPVFVGYLLVLGGAALTLLGWAMAACCFLAGRFLARRKHWVFCMIVAGMNCMHIPFGTVLAVFTIIVLLRPSVKTMFAEPPPVPIPGAMQQSG